MYTVVAAEDMTVKRTEKNRKLRERLINSPVVLFKRLKCLFLFGDI
jgi:hypothetical protein